MLDMRKYQVRYFEIIFPDGLKIEVEPPKLKVLKKIMKMAKIDAEDMDDDSVFGLIEACSMALSKNKQGRTITSEYVEDTMDMVQIQELLEAYFGWVSKIESAKN